ncbi:MAG: hypothetical protein GY861_21015 [bacterium]|nr:hypothetical protein [bacterium]
MKETITLNIVEANTFVERMQPSTDNVLYKGHVDIYYKEPLLAKFKYNFVGVGEIYGPLGVVTREPKLNDRYDKHYVQLVQSWLVRVAEKGEAPDVKVGELFWVAPADPFDGMDNILYAYKSELYLDEEVRSLTVVGVVDKEVSSLSLFGKKYDIYQ